MTLPNPSILDIIISLILIYALLSILVSIMIEWWNHKTMKRGKQLRDAIHQLLDDPLNKHYGELFYSHFLIKGLRSDVNRLPQYVSSGLFADVLMDMITKEASHDQVIKLTSVDAVEGKQYEVIVDELSGDLTTKFDIAFKVMNPSPLKDALELFWNKAERDHVKFRKFIEDWFNDYMDRVSGWFKVSQKRPLLICGIIVAIGLNVDSLHLFKVISLDEGLRNNLVATAENVANEYVKRKDSTASDASQLLKTFSSSLPPEQKSMIKSNPESAAKYFLDKKDTANYTKVIHFIKKDSAAAAYLSKADSVLSIASGLDLPIGWSDTSAPVGWFVKKQNINVTNSIGPKLLAYYERRNGIPDFWIVFKYILGIAITSVSLSFGAPFWFDLLVKFINIRKAGVKPDPSKTEK